MLNITRKKYNNKKICTKTNYKLIYQILKIEIYQWVFKKII